jgi:hypothetical protein
MLPVIGRGHPLMAPAHSFVGVALAGFYGSQIPMAMISRSTSNWPIF